MKIRDVRLSGDQALKLQVCPTDWPVHENTQGVR
jgi:hypothetical protein